jgi:NAD+ kinase
MITVGVVARSDLQQAGTVVGELIAWLKARGVTVWLEERTARLLSPPAGGLSIGSGREVAAAANVVVVLGGDGTLLQASHWVDRDDVLLLAVNFGSLGFLTEVTLDELYPALEGVLTGKAPWDKRRMLRAVVTRPGHGEHAYDVLNDVVVTKASLSRIIELDVVVDGAFVSAFRADGLIVSSPTGSTAYNLAAGGPILHPALEAIVITPICPHMLTNRPLVVKDTCSIEVRLRAGRDVAIHVSFDGQTGISLTQTDSLRISRSPRALRLVTSPGRDYFEVLRAKLKWGDSAVRRP